MSHDRMPAFLSFSSRDDTFVCHLQRGLECQGLEIWDYSALATQVPLGAKLQRTIEQRIRQCQLFVFVASRWSLDPELGHWPLMELKLAMELGLHERGQLKMVVLQSAPATWPEDFRDLRSWRYQVAQDSVDGALAAAQEICRSLRLPYQPTVDIHSLPLGRRLARELMERAGESSNTEGFRAEFNRAIAKADRFSICYEEGRFREAVKIARGLHARVEDELGIDLYFATIAAGVCHLHLEKLELAEDAFAQARDHPLSDENAWGGLGWVWHLQGKFGEAASAFLVCLERNPEDPLARFNHVLNKHLAGHGCDPQELLQIDLDRLQPEDTGQCLELLAAIHIDQREFDQAERAIRAWPASLPISENATIFLWKLLVRRGDHEGAEAFLREQTRQRRSPMLRQHLARYYLQLGQITKAEALYHELLAAASGGLLDPANLRIRMELARVLWAEQRLAEAQAIAAEVVEQSRQGLADDKDKEVFYWIGLAHYLCRDEGTAHLMRSMSRRGPEYDQLLKGDLSAGWTLRLERNPVRPLLA